MEQQSNGNGMMYNNVTKLFLNHQMIVQRSQKVNFLLTPTVEFHICMRKPNFSFLTRTYHPTFENLALLFRNLFVNNYRRFENKVMLPILLKWESKFG